MIGRTLAHYEVLDLLGKGGMGEVYRARDTKLEREVALKILPESVASDPERLARFRREARVLASLNHPHIAQVHGLEEEDEHSFLVMELAEGMDLSERILQGPLPTEDALDVARQIAEGLCEAHQRSVVHRDLKPANVKLRPDGKIKILDFGLARAFAADDEENGDPSMSPTITAAMTQAGTIMGTAAYMSPEQAKGRRVDQRADIWALGVLLWEMLTGRQLFEAESVSETLACVLRVEPDWEELQDQPAELRSLLRQCLEKDPARRFRDAADVALVLEDVRARLGTGTLDRSVESPSSSGSRTPTWVWGVIGALGIACATLAVLWWGGGESRSPEPLRLSINLPPDLHLVDTEPSVSISPDGTRLVYAAHSGDGQNLYLRTLDEFDARMLPGTEGGEASSFSPDGQWILFSREGELCKLALEGGSPTVLAQSDPWGATWTEDDQIVFTPSYTSGLSRVSAGGGPVEVLTEPDSDRRELGHWWPQAIAGTPWVLFTVWSTPFDSVAIRALSLESGEQRELLRGGTYARWVDSGHLLYARDGQLMAQALDLGSMTLTGTPVSVLDDIPIDSNDGNSQLAISRNGILAHLSASELLTPRHLVWIGEDGTERFFDATTRQYNAPRLSPDGRRLLVTIKEQGNEDVWILDRDRGTWSRLTFGSSSEFNGHWTPDSRWIYYNVERPQFDIARRRADASAEPELVVTNTIDKLVTSISADGQWLLYTENTAQTESDVWMLSLEEGAEPRAYLKTPFAESSAVFSTDGRWVAYVSGETGRREVYVRGFPEPGRQWQISSGGGEEPLWSRDGRHLFYRNGRTFYRVTVSTDDKFEAGRPEALFDVNHRPYWAARGYEQSLDGTELLVVQTPPESLPRSIRVITHWFDELERKVGR